MSNQALMIVCSTLTAVYGAVFAFALNKVRKFPIALEEMAADTKSTLTPSQEARVKDNATKEKIAAVIITMIFIGFMILSMAVSSAMAWSVIPVDSDSALYAGMQIAGILSVCCSWLLEWWCMKAFTYRIDYLTAHYFNPVEARPSRLADKELDVLRRGPYRFFREPLSAAFRFLAAAVVLSGQSWFLGVLFLLIAVGNEVLVIELDGKWKRFFLPEAYERYTEVTGGQFLSTCLNGFEKRIQTAAEEKFAKLAEQDRGYGHFSSPQPPIIYVQQYKSTDIHIRNASSPQME